MQNWKDYRNFRKHENADGSFTYTILVDGESVEVNEEIYTAYAEIGRKMNYMELDLKCDRVVQDAKGRAVLDENGLPVRLPEREVSLDRLISEDWDYPSSEPSPEGVVLERIELDALGHALDLLDADERELIYALFFEGLTIREYAERMGQSKSKIDRQKAKILGKLKKFMGN